MVRKVACFFLIIVVICMSAGCGASSELPEYPDTDITERGEEIQDIPATPARGGRLNVAIPRPDTMNPLLTQLKDMVSFFSLIFESMFEYDENLRPRPVLVESWEVFEGGTMWYFHLRKGVKWHHGRELTARDVAFTFNVLREGVMGSFYEEKIAGNDCIEGAGVKPDDPYTFYLKLQRPAGNVLDIMTFPVLPEDVYVSAENMIQKREDMDFLPVGTGPFKIDTDGYVKDKQIRLIRNENWWGGQPYIDSVVAKVYRSREAALDALKNKEVDVVDAGAYFGDVFLKTGDAKVYRYITRRYEFLGFNFENPLFQDVRIRRAIACALDRKEIISTVYLNNAEAVDTPIPSNSWLYDGSSRIYDYDPEKAAKLLADAGWVDSDGDGILDRTVSDRKVELAFSIMTNEDNSLRKGALELIKKQLEEVGIRVEPRLVSWEDMKNRYLPRKEFDAVLAGYCLDTFPDFRFMFHSEEAGMGLHNFIGYKDEELDRLMSRAASTFDPQSLLKLYSRIQRRISYQLPVVSLYFETGFIVANKKICGIEAPLEMDIYRNIEEWYLKSQ